ncbi:hypothetical protein ACFO6V_08040 [Promicromonospora alba]|uniref:Uncharacterized protein n=1 Tax=Promicromonospora alba TaxID=1616110 RepID=A0ABV9HFZ5_9MICO
MVGGLIERGDIHRMLTSLPANADGTPGLDLPTTTLDPDDLADAVWRIAAVSEREIVADAITV